MVFWIIYIVLRYDQILLELDVKFFLKLILTLHNIVAKFTTIRTIVVIETTIDLVMDKKYEYDLLK